MDEKEKMIRKKRSTSLQEMRMLLRQPALTITILLILSSLIIFILFPLYKIAKLSLTDQTGHLTVSNLINVFTSLSYRITFFNSLKLAITVAFIATIVAYIFAYALTRTDLPGKKFFNLIIQLPIVSPPFILALAVIFLFGRQGLITRSLLGIKNHNVYGMHSLVLIQVISYFPVAFMTLTGILGAIDSSVEDAALNAGASNWHTFWTVTFPLSMPGVVSAFLLTFVQSLEDFSNPAVIGGDYAVLATEAYRIITGLYDFNGGAALAIMLMLPTVCAFILQRYWLGHKSFVTVTGKPTQKTRRMNNSVIPPLFVFCSFVVVFILLLYGTVFVGAFCKTWGVNYSLGFSHFKYVWGYGKEALKKSITLACVAAPITGVLGIGIAYLTSRKRFPGKGIMKISSLLTFAIPGTVLGIGYISAFNTKPILLTGTATILVAAFVFRNISVAIESGSSTLLQIDKSIEEASTILGAGTGTTFRRITLPLLKQPFFAGIVFSFVRSVTAVSTVVFLVSPKWPLATSKIFGLFEISKYSDAAAFVTLMIVVILVAIAIINFIVNIILKPRVHKI
jgi:iron(III) transport system permease protein